MSNLKTDVLIIGAGPSGIFTALEMLKNGSKKKIMIVEKGLPVEKRHCPKAKTGKCVNCKPDCNITTGFSGAGAFSDGKLSLSCEVGGNCSSEVAHEGHDGVDGGDEFQEAPDVEAPGVETEAELHVVGARGAVEGVEGEGANV